MTTYAPTASVIAHTSDAAYRAWVADFLNLITNGNWSLGGTMFSNVAQTSDTGQVTTGTLASATRPGTNTANLSFLLKFNDTNAGSAPIYIKFEFGTGAAATSVGLWITVGTSSNGSGTLSGAGLARTAYSATIVNTATTLSSYACCVDGMLSIVFKNLGFNSSNSFMFSIGRTIDQSTGSPTADGWLLIGGMANAQFGSISANAAGSGLAGSNSFAYCMINGSITATLVGGVAQVFKWYAAIPKVMPVPFLCALNAELPAGTTFTATPFGSTSRTFMPITLGGNQFCNVNNVAANFCMIWE